MPNRRRYGISCPTCDASSKVIDTVRQIAAIERVRRCRAAHLFHTDETLYQSDLVEDWTTESTVLNSRNLADRIRRERIVPGGTQFQTMERIRTSS